MKKLMTMAIVGILMLVAVPVMAEGFRDMNWGDAITSDFEVISEDTKDSTKYCIKKNENLKIGEVEVTAITYTFFKDRLMSVAIQANEKYSLYELAKAKFGNPSSNNPYVVKATFGNNKTTCDVQETYSGSKMKLYGIHIFVEWMQYYDKVTKDSANQF